MSLLPLSIKSNLTNRYIKMLTGSLISLDELRACESNPERKEGIIESFKKNNPKQAQVFEKKIKKIIDDERYSTDEVSFPIKDVEYAYFAYGFEPSEYVYFHLADKDIRTFVSDVERVCVKYAMNDFTQSVFADKAKTYSSFKKWYKRDAIIVKKKADYDKYERFVSAHPTYVIKLVNSSVGKGVWVDHITSDYKKRFLQIIRHGKVLLEEVIIQNEVMNQFNSSSVNTIRLCTYLTRSGVASLHGFFRTGREGKFVDNAGAGGLFALIDTKRGMVVSDGVDKYGNSYPLHPDSHMKYDGFKLPEWEKALEMCEEASLLFPEVKYKSFDLAYSDKGWVIVEINPSGELVQQACMETGMKDELRTLMENMDLVCPYSLR